MFSPVSTRLGRKVIQAAEKTRIQIKILQIKNIFVINAQTFYYKIIKV